MALTHLRAWIPGTSPLKLSWQFFPSLPQTVDKHGVPSTYSNRRRHEEFSKEACLPANAALQSCGGPVRMRSTRDLQIENGACKRPSVLDIMVPTWSWNEQCSQTDQPTSP